MSRATLVALFTIFAICSAQPSAPGNTVNFTNLHSKRHSMCSPGTYSSNGSAPCTDCPAGSYSKENGAKSCIPARAGYFCPTPGMNMEYSCAAGTYNGVAGSTSCSPCPPGHQCPSGSLAKPQPCSPGRFSPGGNVVTCSPCPVGSFNNAHGSTGCCACCAGHFNSQPGNTNCQTCPNQTPYSSPGTTSQGGCSSKKGMYVPEPTCIQKVTDSCPTAQAFPSAAINSKRDIHRRRCLKPGQKACPLYSVAIGRSSSKLRGYDCIDINNDLESCGGCVDRSLDGERSSDGGRDCSAIPNVDTVRCEARKCVIESCRPGSVKSVDGEHCILTSTLRIQE
ncbi:hypothetical protein BDZ94DRAFT_264697 [Collybia nuda]|uniref:Tyrosine-protein kinase ephrin type A/B receptor-like domain-containing protein n=1 Tax=Collybia nuda TaxID=64659 RepID=A0A9P6CDL9_9AGAR|nr:hypothetical protein BDZ94DRAFT_264697 [Collybia nuda]